MVAPKIQDTRHPDYTKESEDWTKFRLTMDGGQAYLDAYLEKLSVREDATDFASRKKISYVNAQAKAAILEVKNAIHNRMFEILREGGAESYQKAVNGENGGVDKKNNTMNSFISTCVIAELLSMRKVGVYIDKQGLGDIVTLRESRRVTPYLYTYSAEDILSWAYNDQNELEAILLRDRNYKTDDNGLVTTYEIGYRLLQLDSENGATIVRATLYDVKGDQTSQVLLNLRKIPFVIFELSQSLLTDIANYQIALTNVSSADINYTFKANFPFYTEQYDPKVMIAGLMKSGSTDGTDAGAAVSSDPNIQVGATHGRKYPKGIERPDFIHPSSEPLIASMEKQAAMKEEIRQLLNLSLTNLSVTRRASSESKQMDERGKEAGLATIAFVLQAGEREIVQIWSMYDGSNTESTINYPSQYSLKSDEDRQVEADRLLESLPKIPSLTFQKVIAKQAAKLLVGTEATTSEIKKILEEIESAKVVNIDPEVIINDHKEGFVCTDTASRARLYPEGEVAKAKVDHAERLRRIAESQSSGIENPQARGLSDLVIDNKGGTAEKAISQNQDISPDNSTGKRGEAK